MDDDLDPVIEKRMRRMVTIAHSRPGHGKQRLYAEIWKGRRRVSFGWNNKKTSELSQLYARHEKVVGTCAEAESIIQALSRHAPVAGAAMLVARAKRTRRGGPVVAGHSLPCAGCQRLLRDFKIAEFYYFDENGNVRHEDIA